jgi:hypothetical protein
MVVGILALLLGIIVSVVRGVVGNAKAAATKATMRKVDGLLMKRVAAFERYCDGQDKLAAGTIPSYARETRNRNVFNTVLTGYQRLGGTNENFMNAWGAGTASRQALLVLARKAYFRQAFPQTLAELKLDNGMAGDSEVAKVAEGSPTEHAEVFYLSLTRLDSFGVEAGDLDEFKSNELSDTDANGIPEFIDGWGHPFRFYRWPTRLVRPVLSSNPGQVQDLIRNDPMDGHDLWHYSHTIPVGPEYVAGGASYTLLIATPPQTSGSVTRGSSALLGHEHNDPLAKDPADPRNRLHPGESSSAATYAQWQNFVQWMEQNLHTPDAYHIPLIVSAGLDDVLGLYEPTAEEKYGHLAQPDMGNLNGLFDNITNRNLQAGAN